MTEPSVKVDFLSLPQLSVTSERLNSEVCCLTSFPELMDGLLFLNEPEHFFIAHTFAEVSVTLERAEAAARSGSWVAGFIAYEAAGSFGLPVNRGAGEKEKPLVWLATFSKAYKALLPDPRKIPTQGTIVGYDTDFTKYQDDLTYIRQAIERGDTYQVNHTVLATIAACDPGALFLRLQGLHRFPYGVWLHTGSERIASFSPELFVNVSDRTITTAPIKGTRRRVADVVADAKLAWELEHAAKDRAEHAMIVDMARNDLGKVCAVGSVGCCHLLERRSFSSIHHLETRVTGTLTRNVGFREVMAALFPAASITGAPKKKTMAIIREREKRARGIYTGSLGVMTPGGRDWGFNVAIRTLCWTGEGAVATMGLGGGIVADSKVEDEWRELADKGRFLSEPPTPFGLIETCLVDDDGVISRLPQHLARLSRSASLLGLPCDVETIHGVLCERAKQCHPSPRVMRLELHPDGSFSIVERDFIPVSSPIRVWVAPVRMDRLDPLLRHKTTRRNIFSFYHDLARQSGFADALFVNTVGHVTEGAIRAIAVCFKDGWVVPPVADGLLPSLWRQEFMARHHAREQSITLADLEGALEIRMGNAVTGEVVVEKVCDDTGQ
ncbi:MAG: chorismate-binding protein [Magnetococcales bacterium]|nr:chorismate-binding protein [Magnetococcales bacterium]